MFDDAKQPSGVFGAVAAIAVVILKSVSDVFKAPLLASILIVVGAGLLSAVISRLYAVISGRRDAAALLWISPGTSAATADPLALGITPARECVRPPDEDLPPYVGRDIDEHVRAALERPNALVLIVGPALAGKSRTAFEAVRGRNGDDSLRLLYPRNAEALGRLAASDLPRRRNEPMLLWLDDLPRYGCALDADTWSRLVRKWPSIKLVATVRTGDYIALCKASGHLGETRRFLLARSARFQLGSRWTADEVARASERGLELSEGGSVAKAFAVDWNGWAELEGKQAPASAAPVAKMAVRDRVRGFRPDRLSAVLCGLLIGVVCIGLFLWLVAGSFRAAPPPLSTENQLAGIRNSALFANDDVQRWSADLQGDGQSSYVFYSHSKAFGQTLRNGGFPKTDTLRIYDDSDTAGSLTPAFVYAPTYISASAQLTGDAEFFEKRGLADLMGGGEAQLIGGYSPANAPSAPTLPVIIYWDETAKAYTVDALMQKPPSLARVANPSRAAASYRAAYTKLSVLAARPIRGPYVLGYPVQDLAIVQGHNGPRLVVGYVAQTVGHPPRISELEVQAWSLGQDPVTGDPKLQTRCVLRSDPARRFFIAPLPGLSYPTLLKEYWEQFDALALC